MSAWPEAIYIIKKLNTSISNIEYIQNDLINLAAANQGIDDLNKRVITGGLLSDGITNISNPLTPEITSMASDLALINATQVDPETGLYPEGSLAQLQAQINALNTTAVNDAAAAVLAFDNDLVAAKHEIVIISTTAPTAISENGLTYHYNKYTVWMQTYDT